MINSSNTDHIVSNSQLLGQLISYIHIIIFVRIIPNITFILYIHIIISTYIIHSYYTFKYLHCSSYLDDHQKYSAFVFLKKSTAAPSRWLSPLADHKSNVPSEAKTRSSGFAFGRLTYYWLLLYVIYYMLYIMCYILWISYYNIYIYIKLLYYIIYDIY